MCYFILTNRSRNYLIKKLQASRDITNCIYFDKEVGQSLALCPSQCFNFNRLAQGFQLPASNISFFSKISSLYVLFFLFYRLFIYIQLVVYIRRCCHNSQCTHSGTRTRPCVLGSIPRYYAYKGFYYLYIY